MPAQGGASPGAAVCAAARPRASAGTGRQGLVVARVTVAHSGEGLAKLLAWLGGHGVAPASAAAAIETPRGAVVETMVRAGYAVSHLNPKALDRFRDRHSPAGAKDDDRDAFVLANSLRTDPPLFQPVPVESPAVIRLRQLCRTNDELRREQHCQASRLVQLLNDYYPQLLTLCPDAKQPFVWDLLELAPTRPGLPNSTARP